MQVKVYLCEYPHNMYGKFTASCAEIPNVFFSDNDRKKCLMQLIAALQAKGLSGTLKIQHRIVEPKTNQQEAAYNSYRAKGGTLPLSVYING